MSNKIIKQQLNILNGQDLPITSRLKKLKKSPLDKVKENKVDEDKVLEENLKLLKKHAIIQKESKAARKKREIVAKNIEKQKEIIAEGAKKRRAAQLKKRKEQRTSKGLELGLLN
eukprot:gene1282-1617_t